MATCASVRVCDVPIDLDGRADDFILDILGEQEQKTSTKVVLPTPQRKASTSTCDESNWSSSSGSFYSDEEDSDLQPFTTNTSTSPLPTSPLVNSAKCWWALSPRSATTPKSDSLGGSDWSSSSDTHDSGYFSRPHTMDDQKPKELEGSPNTVATQLKQRRSGHLPCQVCQ
jgi:hypothetical protein